MTVDNADIDHLLDLIDMLPSVTEDHAGFWRSVKAADGDSNYLLEKLYVWTRNTRELDRNLAEAPRRLAEYCLLFFGKESDSMADLMEAVAPDLTGRAGIGRRWVADVAETAWRVYVAREAVDRRRYHGAFGTGVDMNDWPPPAVD